MEYIEYFKEYLMGKDCLSEDFVNLLKSYDLAPYYGSTIKKKVFENIFIPYDRNENIIYQIWTRKEFKKEFIKIWKGVHPNKEFNPEIFDQYKVTDEYLKQKEEIIKVDSILKEYMGKNKVSNEYLKDLKDYNLLGGYFEITLKFYLTPLNELQNVSDIREYVLTYLKKLSRVTEIDNRRPQTIKDAINYIIINFNKKGIRRIRDNEDLNSILNLIETFFTLGKNSNLLFECFYSKYNSYGFKIFFDEHLASKIILKELQEYVCQNYEKIINLNLKDTIVEKYSYETYVRDDIDEFSLNYLNELFSDEFNEILDYYNLSEEKKEKLKCLVYHYCYHINYYSSENYRRFRILDTLTRYLEIDFNLDVEDLEKLNNYLNIDYLKEITVEERIKEYLKATLKYDIFCETFFNELKKRNLLDYDLDMSLYNRSITLNSKEKIIEFIDEFEKNDGLPIPKSLMDAINYLIENSSKEFIDEVYNSPQSDIRRLHFTLGMWIRNEFGFHTHKNPQLEYDCNDSKYYYASWEADNLSYVILSEMWEYIQKNYDEIIKNTEFTNNIDINKYIISLKECNNQQ